MMIGGTRFVCSKVVYLTQRCFYGKTVIKMLLRLLQDTSNTPNILTQCFIECLLRFHIYIYRVIDFTDSTTFVLFERDATTLLKKSCVDIIKSEYKVHFLVFYLELSP